MKLKRFLQYLSPFEWLLWTGSLLVITLSYLWGENSYFLSFIASLVGVSALIFIAKGNVIGQFLIIIFCLLYGTVSLRFRYYGELITYVCMSLPSAVTACVTWLKNPSQANANEVKVGNMTKRKWILLTLASLTVTTLFYFILRYFQTPNLPLSTLSVTTSFFASMLLILRSPYYALAYGANDLVLIGLWTYASFADSSYLPMLFCFITFLANDAYGFVSWIKMEKRQKENQS